MTDEGPEKGTTDCADDTDCTLFRNCCDWRGRAVFMENAEARRAQRRSRHLYGAAPRRWIFPIADLRKSYERAVTRESCDSRKVVSYRDNWKPDGVHRGAMPLVARA